ncbi:MAG: CysZ protein [Alphaproteobacteria bacterium]|nr:CysZ protein [Alphaproteobacteria bacterium]
MLDAAIKALSQMFSPPFRTVLWKSVGLALILIVLVAVGLHRVLIWVAASGQTWLQDAFGVTPGVPVALLAWMLSVVTGLGVIAGSVFLMPAVTALVASFFVDDIALEVERVHYPADPPGAPPPLLRALFEGVKTALLTVLVYLIALPFLLFAGFGAVIFFFATAFLLGREYFELAAMRFHPAAEAKRLRKMHQGTVFVAGMLVAAFVMIPILNLATPLFGMAFMVHMHKRLAGPRRPRIEQAPG